MGYLHNNGMNTIYTKKITQKETRRKGAVLLIAVLLASVTLSVGLGIYQRTYKQLLFASFWKQMQIAFSAADGGLECAMYWDLRQTATSASCFGSQVLLTGGGAWDPSLNADASLAINTATACATVNIIKNGSTPFTTINARGYDTCDINNPRRVERGLRIDY